jgi:hypothetical protein
MYIFLIIYENRQITRLWGQIRRIGMEKGQFDYKTTLHKAKHIKRMINPITSLVFITMIADSDVNSYIWGRAN